MKAALHQASGLGSHHSYGETNKTANNYGTTTAKISTVMNEGVEIHFKSVTTQVFTVLSVLAELGTVIEK